MKTGNGASGRVSVTLRIPGRILDQIDASLDREDVPVSRNHWIIEALVQRLRRTQSGKGESDGTR